MCDNNKKIAIFDAVMIFFFITRTDRCVFVCEKTVCCGFKSHNLMRLLGIKQESYQIGEFDAIANANIK